MIAKIVIRSGVIRFFNTKNHIHRLRGPAVQYISGTKMWLFDGKYHRLHGYSCIRSVLGEKIRTVHIHGVSMTHVKFNRLMNQLKNGYRKAGGYDC